MHCCVTFTLYYVLLQCVSCIFRVFDGFLMTYFLVGALSSTETVSSSSHLTSNSVGADQHIPRPNTPVGSAPIPSARVGPAPLTSCPTPVSSGKVSTHTPFCFYPSVSRPNPFLPYTPFSRCGTSGSSLPQSSRRTIVSGTPATPRLSARFDMCSPAGKKFAKDLSKAMVKDGYQPRTPQVAAIQACSHYGQNAFFVEKPGGGKSALGKFGTVVQLAQGEKKKILFVTSTKMLQTSMVSECSEPSSI